MNSLLYTCVAGFRLAPSQKCHPDLFIQHFSPDPGPVFERTERPLGNKSFYRRFV